MWEDGTPEQIFEHPRMERTRHFIRRLKVFEAVIDGADYDFYGIMTRLDQYGYKNDLPAGAVARLRSLFEELCHQLLRPEMPGQPIRFTAEYDGDQGETTAVIRYPGKPWNPMDSDNQIAVAILRNLAAEIRYSRSEAGEGENRVTVKLKP